MTATQERATRRDARRNHDAVLAAATEVLSEVGPEATMESIAARAGVGVGTVYRHFPNKDALVEALVRAIYTDVIAAADAALARGDGTGLARLLRELGRAMARHRGYAHLLVGHAAADCGSGLLRARIAALLDDAKAAGTVGADVTLGDVMMLTWALRGVIDVSAAVAPSAWERHLEIHLAALQAPSLGSRRRGLTTSELARVSAHTR